MITLLPLQRARLEVDRTLRTRAFFARAVTGDLDLPDYAALVGQLSGLLSAASGDAAIELCGLARDDLDVLSSRITSVDNEPCAAVRLLHGAASHHRDLVPVDVAFDVATGLIGTSWARDAAMAGARRASRPAAFLRRLADAGDASLGRLRHRFRGDLADSDYACAFGELTRGALLGVATYLDGCCPPPIVVTTLESKEEKLT